MNIAIVAVTVAHLTTGALRVQDEGIREVVYHMIASSRTFATLVDRLERSDVIIYVEYGQCPHLVRSCVQLAASTHANRYLRVKISKHAKRVIGRLVAHELQHALEIADAPFVVDTRSLVSLYRQIGYPNGINQFETANALAIEDRVSLELRAYLAVASASQ